MLIATGSPYMKDLYGAIPMIKNENQLPTNRRQAPKPAICVCRMPSCAKIQIPPCGSAGGVGTKNMGPPKNDGTNPILHAPDRHIRPNPGESGSTSELAGGLRITLTKKKRKLIQVKFFLARSR